MIRLVGRWLPGREIVWVADSRFAVLDLLAQVQPLPHTSVLTRLRLAAALYAPAPPRQPRTTGRPRLKGTRRPTLAAVVVDERTPWTRVCVAQWDGKGPREVEVATDTAVWYHTGKPPGALRWVLIRDPHGRCKPQALLSTNLVYKPTQILTLLVKSSS